MKHLNNFYNHAELPWVKLTWSKLYCSNQTPPQARSPVGSFWWKEVLKLFGAYNKLTECTPNWGNSDLFWSGNWCSSALKDKYPQLFSFSRKPKCSIRFFLNNEMEVNFRLPLSTQVARQLSDLLDSELGREWDENVTDIPAYISAARKFTTSLFRTWKKLLPSSLGSGPPATLGNINFSSGCFLETDSARNLLRRKNMHLDDYSCVLCSTGHEETSFHLFFECSLSQACWNSISINWNLNLPL